MRYFLLILVCLIASFGVFMSCTDELPTQPQRMEVSNENTILEAALRTADQFFNQIGAATRSNGRRVGSVHYVTPDIQTRGESDTLMILINYEGNQGFAFMPNPKYSHDIYAISPEGALEYSDFDTNPILKDFYNDCKLNALVMAAVAENPAIREDLDGFDIIWKDYDVDIIRRSDPMLNPKVARWEQDAPYNDSCKMIEETHLRGLVGCGALSFGQLLSYYQHPSGSCRAAGNGEINVCGFKWDSILSKSNYTAQLLSFLGGKKILDSTYEVDWTETDPSSFVSAVGKLKYWSTVAFNLSLLKDSLESVSEFLIEGIRGYDKAPVICFSQANGMHSWIIDAAVERIEYPINNGNPLYMYARQLPTLFHCVWGFSGDPKYNGYYSYDVNDDMVTQYIYRLKQYDSGKYYMQIDSLLGTKKYYANWHVFGGLKRVRTAYPVLIL